MPQSSLMPQCRHCRYWVPRKWLLHDARGKRVMEDISCDKMCPAQRYGGMNCTYFEREPGADDEGQRR
jgi:hypothetical protein